MARKEKPMKKTKILIITAIIAITAISCSGIRKGCAVEQPEDTEVITRTVEEYEVQFGDSLSGITAKYCPEYIDTRKYLYDLQQLNNRKSNIYAGEVLKVYVYR